MTPILYDKNETDFNAYGYGALAEAIRATVSESRNGAYELTMQYPVTGRLFDYIEGGTIIKAKANETSDPQLFRVYKVGKPKNGICTVNAEHISYDLCGLPVGGFSVKSSTAQRAIHTALEATPFQHDFTALSSISTLNSTSIPKPCSVRAILGGQEGSVLDVWGGEYEFDNFVIKLHASRGSDNHVRIEYGKNLTDVNQEENIADCYTHLMPYAVYTEDDGEGNTEDKYVYLTEKVIPLSIAGSIGHQKAYIKDFTDQFDDEIPTESALRAKAVAFANTSNLGTPKINITVSFIQLWQTEEYKNIAPLERVSLCDTVGVYFSKLGIDANAKVIKTVYDVLRERYESLTLGDAKSNFADTVNSQQNAITKLMSAVAAGESRTTAAINAAIDRATNAITGQSGGYVVLDPPENPQQILIMDNPDKTQALRVWRWNSGGLGYSKTGYNGTYGIAMTMDGEIVADYIATGSLDGGLIRAGTIEADALSVAYKSSVEQAFKVADEQLLSTIQTNYSTTEQMNSAINQTAAGLTIEINKKVNNSEFGTKIEANASSVRIAWNSLSNYIKLENAELNIYNTSNTKLISFNSAGETIYYNSTKVGTIGSGVWGSDSTKRGLAFNLENSASYMTWAWRINATDSAYSTKWTYAATEFAPGFTANQLHAGCDINLHSHHLRSASITDWAFDGGTVSGTLTGLLPVTIGSDGIISSWRTITLTFNRGILQSATF